MTIKRKLNFQDFLIIFILSFLAFSILVSAARITLPTHDESSVTTVTSSSFACEFGLKVSKDNSSAQMDLLEQGIDRVGGILLEDHEQNPKMRGEDYVIESKDSFKNERGAFYVFSFNPGTYVFHTSLNRIGKPFEYSSTYPPEGYLEVTKNGVCKFAKVYKIN